MARSTCRAADGWPNAPTLRAPFSRWWENAATTASDISSLSHRAIGVSVKRELSILPPGEFQAATDRQELSDLNLRPMIQFGITGEFRFAHKLANLEMILRVEFLPAQLLDREMFRMGGPRTQRVG